MNLTPRARRPRSLPAFPFLLRPRHLGLPLAAVVIVTLTFLGAPAPAQALALADDATMPAAGNPAAVPDGNSCGLGPATGPAPGTAPDAPGSADPADPSAVSCATDTPAPVPETEADPAATPAPGPTSEPRPEPGPTSNPEPTPAPAPVPTPEPSGEPTPLPTAAPTAEPTATPTPPAPPAPSAPPAPPAPPAPEPDPTAASGSTPVSAEQAAARAAEAQASVARDTVARQAAIRAAASARAAERVRSAEQAVAAQESAQRAAAYSAALARADRAQASYDAARLAYAAVKADYDAAVVQADQVRDRGAEATAAAEASRRALATLVRATMQQSGPEAVDVLLAGNSEGDDLLSRLATLATLDRLTNSLDEVEARVDADAKREQALLGQDAALRATIEAIPLADTRIAMEEAQQELDAAAAEVADIAASTPVALSLTPLPDPALITGTDNDFGGRLRGQLSSQGWAAPAIGPLSDGFGPRPDRPLPNVNEFHAGTDIAAACGAAVYAASDGVVAASEPLGTYGNWILIDHGDGAATGYAHLAEGQTVVSVGETVIAGQVIASVGSTGASTGCHLHFEVRVDGIAVDPQPFLEQRGVRFD